MNIDPNRSDWSAGIDLATTAKMTGVCYVEWVDRCGVVHLPVERATDDFLVEVLASPVPVGVDAPFGWPVPFIDQLVSWRDLGVWPGGTDSPERRRVWANRRTDLSVAERVGRRPLSVSTDRIGLTSMRCAALLEVVGRRIGHPVDRALGRDGIYEVWPASALAAWSLRDKGYKGADGPERRTEMLAELTERGRLRVDSETFDRLVGSDDAFDALVSALNARAAHCGRAHPPTDLDLELAEVEGWIHVPRVGSLELLIEARVS